MSELEKANWLQAPSSSKLDKSKCPEAPSVLQCILKSRCLDLFSTSCSKKSSIRKFKRNVASVLKVRPAQPRSEKSINPVLTAANLARAEKCIWFQVQNDSFTEEVSPFPPDKSVPSSFKLAALVSCLHNCLIRVRGRL